MQQMRGAKFSSKFPTSTLHAYETCTAWCPNLKQIKIGNDRLAACRRQLPCTVICHPAVDAAPTTENPEYVLEAKVIYISRL